MLTLPAETRVGSSGSFLEKRSGVVTMRSCWHKGGVAERRGAVWSKDSPPSRRSGGYQEPWQAALNSSSGPNPPLQAAGSPRSDEYSTQFSWPSAEGSARLPTVGAKGRGDDCQGGRPQERCPTLPATPPLSRTAIASPPWKPCSALTRLGSPSDTLSLSFHAYKMGTIARMD